MVFTKKNWAVDVLSVARVSLLLRLSQMRELRNMFVYSYMHIYTYTKKGLWMSHSVPLDVYMSV